MNTVFPIFVRAKDTKEVAIFLSLEEIQRELEAIDVENGEYEAWDKEGVPLSMSVQTPVWLKLLPASSVARPEPLREAILSFASSIGVQLNQGEQTQIDLKALLEIVLVERKKKSPRGLFNRWRKQKNHLNSPPATARPY